jgi:preprotein translocase subunit SecE
VAKSSSETKVTRIKAKDDGVKREKAAPEAKVAAPKSETTADKPKKRRFGARMIAYFKGSWRELTLVRWPDRKSTWKMTGALITFTLVFAVVILLLDYVFQYLFKLLIK